MIDIILNTCIINTESETISKLKVYFYCDFRYDFHDGIAGIFTNILPGYLPRFYYEFI